MPETTYRHDDLRALFVNCTLKRSPEVSNTEGPIDRSRAVMERQGVATSLLRAVDHDIADRGVAGYDGARLGVGCPARAVRAGHGGRHPLQPGALDRLTTQLVRKGTHR